MALKAWMSLFHFGLSLDGVSADVFAIMQIGNDANQISLRDVGFNISSKLFAQVGLNGSDEVVGIDSDGLDDESCFFNGANNSVPRNQSANLAYRKVIQYIAFADGIAGPSSVGTLVAGAVAGSPSNNNRNYDGVAPAAKISFFDIHVAGQQSSILPGNLATDLFPLSKVAGAAIHLSSWNAATNEYTTHARDVDSYSWQNEEFVIVAPAGDSGNLGGNTVFSPGTAKNCITVGASLNGIRGSIDDIAPFSSIGPTADGRIKPDVVAPGDSVLSAASERLCGLARASGTSMAAAVIAGAVALVRQYFREGWYPSGSPNATDAFSPSGALLKAMVIHAGRKMTGNTSGFFLYPSVSQGFGRVDLDSVLQVGTGQLERGSLWMHAAKIGMSRAELQVNQVFQQTFTLDIAGSFKATLVWMDAPASLVSQTNLVNDLDLKILSNEVTYYPNGNDQPDRLNNVEMIEIVNATPGIYTVRVEATSITSRPRQQNQPSAQPFALVVTFPSTTTTTTRTVTTASTSTSPDTRQSTELFVRIASGTCVANGFSSISNVTTCQNAAVALLLPVTVAIRTSATPLPYGCYFIGNLFFSMNQANVGNGASDGYDLICSRQAATSVTKPDGSEEDSGDFWQALIDNKTTVVICGASAFLLVLCAIVVRIMCKWSHRTKRFEA